MKMFRAIILEDCVSDVEYFLETTKSMKELEVTGYTYSPKDLIAALQNMERIDLVFIDIDTKEISGRVLAEWIKEKHSHIKIVFTSRYIKRFTKNVEVCDWMVFLSKPILLTDLQQYLSK